jgi:F-type H+-transporting ATPase subunit gamma
VVYNEFKNAAVYKTKVQQFLPVSVEEFFQEKKASTEGNKNFLFEPSETEIVDELIPKSLLISFYRMILESNASEHGARMTAMDKATENAGELLRDLKLTYNKARQSAITNEILEIVGGSDALAG